MSGTAGVRGFEAVVDISASEIFSNLQMGFNGYFGVQKGNWGLGVDVICMSLGASTDYLNVEPGQAAFAFLATRRLAPTLDLTFGARWSAIRNRIEYKTNSPVFPGTTIEGTYQWADPVTGIAWRQPIGRRWIVGMPANLGGFGISAEVAVDIFPNIQYRLRATTDRPIRFAFSTHHHGDHLYGNQVLADQGAIGVARANAVRELERTETGHYGGAPGRWEEAARERPDVAASRLKPPSVTFRGELVFADRTHRVELHHFGTAHTLGDAFAWLPRERILFSGDACVNGPFNFVGDGHVGQWVGTLDAARALDPKTVCPGHGPVAEGGLLGDQQAYFRRVVELGERPLQAQASAQEIRAQVAQMRAEALSDPRIARYAQASSFYDPFPEHIEKVYEELTGKKLAGTLPSRSGGALMHARAHGAAWRARHHA